MDPFLLVHIACAAAAGAIFIRFIDRKSISTARAQLIEKTDELNSYETLLADVQQRLEKSSKEAMQRTRDLKRTSAQVADLEAQLLALSAPQEEPTPEQAEAELELAKANKRLTKVERLLATSQDRVSSLEAELDELSTSVTTERKARIAAERQLSKSLKEVENLSQTLEQTAQSLSRAETQLRNLSPLRKENANLKAKLTIAKEAAARGQASLSKLEVRYKQTERDCDGLRATVTVMDAEKRRLEALLAEIQSSDQAGASVALGAASTDLKEQSSLGTATQARETLATPDPDTAASMLDVALGGIDMNSDNVLDPIIEVGLYEETGLEDDYKEVIHEGLIDEGDFDEVPVLRPIPRHDRVERSQRAYQIAEQLGTEYGWYGDDIKRLAEVFERYGWNSTKRAIATQLEAGMTPAQLVVALLARELWDQCEEFQAYFGPGETGKIQRPALSWKMAVALATDLGEDADEDDILGHLSDWHDEWYGSSILIKRFPAFYDFVEGRLLGRADADWREL
jgi:hypothetical protein